MGMGIVGMEPLSHTEQRLRLSFFKKNPWLLIDSKKGPIDWELCRQKHKKTENYLLNGLENLGVAICSNWAKKQI